MGFFNFIKQKESLKLTVKAPGSFETTTLKMQIEVFLDSPEQTKLKFVNVKLLGKITDRKKFPGAPPEVNLGESRYDETELIIIPNKTEKITFELPVDIAKINSFEIPPENLALASEELKAAASTNRSTNYNYSIVVSTKTNDNHEVTNEQPIALIQPNQVRLG